jgi:hypothetical protein
LQLTRHATDKLLIYGIEGERLSCWSEALSSAERFVDVTTGARGLLLSWEDRPWIVILREDEDMVVTTYPTDHRTVGNRRRGGRWIFLST